MKKIISLLALVCIVAFSSAQITITPTTLDTGYCYNPYSQKVTAAGGVSPYIYTISSGTMPTGFFLAKNSGKITGKPLSTVASSSTFTVTATDAAGASGTRSYTVVVQNKQVTWSNMVSEWGSMPNTYPSYADVYNTYRLNPGNILYEGSSTSVFIPYSDSISTPNENAIYAVGTSTAPKIELKTTLGEKASYAKMDSTKVEISGNDSIWFSGGKFIIDLSTLPSDSSGLTPGTIYRDNYTIQIKR